MQNFEKKFCEEGLQKINRKEFRMEKVIKKKDDKLYVRWKGCDSSFNSTIDKKDIVRMSEYFPELKLLGRTVKVELDLSNYATKTDLKNATGVDIPSFAEKTDLDNLKPDVGKLDVDNLKNISTNWSNWESKVDKLDADKLVPFPLI